MGVLISDVNNDAARDTIGFMQKAPNRVIVFKNEKYANALDSSLARHINTESSDLPDDIADPSVSADIGDKNQSAKKACEEFIQNANQATAGFVGSVAIAGAAGDKPQPAAKSQNPSLSPSELERKAKTCVPEGFSLKRAYPDRYESNENLMHFHFENYFPGNNRYVPKTTNYEVYLDPLTGNSVACIRSETYDAVRGGHSEGTNKMNVNCLCD